MPGLWGYEDTLFFHQLDRAGIATAITGASWLHHFGSITVSALKQERGLSGRQGLGARDNYRLLGKSVLQRKWDRFPAPPAAGEVAQRRDGALGHDAAWRAQGRRVLLALAGPEALAASVSLREHGAAEQRRHHRIQAGHVLQVHHLGRKTRG